MLVSGQVKEARNVLESIARGNGTVMPMAELKVHEGAGAGGRVSMKDLFTGHVVRSRTLKLSFIW